MGLRDSDGSRVSRPFPLSVYSIWLTIAREVGQQLLRFHGSRMISKRCKASDVGRSLVCIGMSHGSSMFVWFFLVIGSSFFQSYSQYSHGSKRWYWEETLLAEHLGTSHGLGKSPMIYIILYFFNIGIYCKCEHHWRNGLLSSHVWLGAGSWSSPSDTAV